MIRFITEKLHIHYAWLVLFTCCCFFGASMGIFNNCASLYTADLLKEMGWSLTLSTVLDIPTILSRVAASAIAYKVFKKYPVKLVLGLSLTILMSAVIAKGFMRGVVDFIIINLVIGSSSAFLLYIPVPMMLNNWFVEKKETVLGIAMLCSGLFAAVLSPVFSSVMLAHDWRYATIVNGIVALAVGLPPILLFAVKTPEEMGLKPYGWKEPDPEAASGINAQQEETDTPHFTREEKKKLFSYCLLLTFLTFAVSYMPARLPHYAATSGIGNAVGGLLLSASMFGNMSGKALLGPLCDRFGLRKTYTVSLILVLFSAVVLCFLPSATAVLLPVAFISGISSGNAMMVYPAAVRTFSSGDEYTYYISKISTAVVLLCMPFTLLLGFLFDTSLSYLSTFLLFTAMEAASLLLALKLFKK